MKIKKGQYQIWGAVEGRKKESKNPFCGIRENGTLLEE